MNSIRPAAPAAAEAAPIPSRFFSLLALICEALRSTEPLYWYYRREISLLSKPWYGISEMCNQVRRYFGMLPSKENMFDVFFYPYKLIWISKHQRNHILGSSHWDIKNVAIFYLLLANLMRYQVFIWLLFFSTVLECNELEG